MRFLKRKPQPRNNSGAQVFSSTDGSSPSFQPYFEELYTPVSHGSNAKELVDPGTDIRQLIMRCVFPSTRESNAVLRLYNRYDKFNDERHKKLLQLKLASTVSVMGRGRLELLFGLIQMLSPEMYQSVIGNKLKRPKNDGKRDTLERQIEETVEE